MYVYIYIYVYDMCVCIQYTLHFSNVHVPMSGTKIDHEFAYQTRPTTCPSCWCSVSRDHSRDLFIRTGHRHYSRWHWSPQAQCFKLHHIQQHWRGQHHIDPLRVDNIRYASASVSASCSVLPLSHVLNKPKSQPLFGCDRKAMKIHHENRSLWLLQAVEIFRVVTASFPLEAVKGISSASSVVSKLGNSINGFVCHWSSSKNVMLTQTQNYTISQVLETIHGFITTVCLYSIILVFESPPPYYRLPAFLWPVSLNIHFSIVICADHCCPITANNGRSPGSNWWR